MQAARTCTESTPCTSKPAQSTLLHSPERASSRMLASTRGSPVVPSLHLLNSSLLLFHSTFLPVVPYSKKILSPYLIVKNLWQPHRAGAGQAGAHFTPVRLLLHSWQ